MTFSPYSLVRLVKAIGLPLLALVLACDIPYYDPSEDRRRREREEAARDTGFDSADFSGTDTDVADTIESTPCQDYCTYLLTYCPDEPTTQEGCVESCLAWPDADFPSYGVRTGNSLSCRWTFVNDAAVDPTACPNAGVAGGTACIDTCTTYCDGVAACEGIEETFNGLDCQTACANFVAFYGQPALDCRLTALADDDAADETICRRARFDACYCTLGGTMDACDPEQPTLCTTAMDTLDDCGECGISCHEGARCINGGCRRPCEGLVCDGTCIDPLTDSASCGAVACGEGALCGEADLCDGLGICAATCSEGFTDCEGSCLETQNDPNNCGDCGIVCGANQSCQAGVCTCDGLWEDCDGAEFTGCETDLASDIFNCGGCLQSCQEGAVCGAGRCRGRIQSIAAGGAHTCIVESGDVACWGANNMSQLGVITDETISEPVWVPGLDNMVEVVVGAAHTCALDEDGQVFCWGDSLNGQGGVLASEPITTPRLVDGLGITVALSAGPSQTCAIDDTGVTRCFGVWVRDGQTIWSNTTGPIVVPYPTLEAVAVGTNHGCGLAQGSLYCLGNNEASRLAVGSTVLDLFRPARVLDITDAREVAAADTHSCALRSNGDVVCWGFSNFGGAGIAGVVSEPRTISLGAAAGGVDAGGDSSCAVLGDGTVRCWGGGLSDDDETVAISGLHDVVEVTLGDAHTCAVLADDTLWCWGENGQGQLGDGGTQDSLSPMEVVLP